ncbi:hypothetical protein SSS_09590 [Sarcoptes scabiei]|nr:hypothetical protein SSS_09590 [Sarcoptes scabiei]
MKNNPEFKATSISSNKIVITKDGKPYVPSSMRQQIFNSYHNLNHPSFKERFTKRKIQEKYYWPSTKTDIQYMSNARCQLSKINKRVKIAPLRSEIPAERFKYIHIDIVSMPDDQGYRYVLTIIDRFTRWIFIRDDSPSRPLRKPYIGTFKVIKRNKHTFTIQIGNRVENVAIDRLKPAKIDKKTVTFNLPNPQGRSRRIVRGPM